MTYHFFSSYIKEILLFLLYKKSEKFLEKNFVYGKISEFLSDFLFDSHDILRLKILKNVNLTNVRHKICN